jgi:Family of unknown function (DUF6252)
MKTKNLLILFVLVTGIALSSCKKTNSVNPLGNGSMSLKVDGTSWSANLAVEAVNTNGVLSITGSDASAHQAAVTLNGATGPGTYQVGSNGNSGNMLRWTEGTGSDQTYQATFIIGSGTIVIDKLSDTEVSGTFEFEGYNTAQTHKSITEGKFSAKF